MAQRPITLDATGPSAGGIGKISFQQQQVAPEHQPSAKRPTLSLQPKEAAAAADVAGEAPSLPPEAAPAAVSAKKGKDRPSTKQEWKEFHPAGGASTKILIDACQIALLIEGAENLKGRTVLGWKNKTDGTLVLDAPFATVFGWYKNLIKHAWKEFTFPDGKRRMMVTRSAISGVCEVEADPNICILRFRAKGAKAVPALAPYEEVAAWVAERKQGKAESE